MPDDYHPPTSRRNPEDIDLGAIKTDLEFLIERVERVGAETCNAGFVEPTTNPALLTLLRLMRTTLCPCHIFGLPEPICQDG